VPKFHESRKTRKCGSRAHCGDVCHLQRHKVVAWDGSVERYPAGYQRFLAIDPDSSVPNEGIWTSREFITLIEGFREMAAPGRIVSVFRKT